VHTHATGTVELAHPAAGLPKAGQPLALGRELLDAIITPVRHINIAVRVQAQAPGHIQLARPSAEGAELAEVFPVQRELLDTVIAAVSQEPGPAADRQACRPVQLAVSSPRLAPFAQEVAACVEDGNPVQPLVGDIDMLLAIQGDGGGPDELPVAFAAGA